LLEIVAEWKDGNRNDAAQPDLSHETTKPNNHPNEGGHNPDRVPVKP